MKRIFINSLTILCFMFQGCSHSCDDQYFFLTIRNESADTVLCAPGSLRYPPFEAHHFIVLSPGAETKFDTYQSTIDYEGEANYVVRKMIVDEYGLDRIIRERLYDTIYTCHSYYELESRGFIIKIKQEDFKD